MRGVFKIIRRILAVIVKKLLYAIFLILLFIRKPVFAFLNFFVGGLVLFLFFFFGDTQRELHPMNTKQQWSLVLLS